MQIFVRYIDGRIGTFEVNPTDRISDLKKLIEDRFGLATCEQRLVHWAWALEDDKTLTQCGVQKESTLSLVPVMRGD